MNFITHNLPYSLLYSSRNKVTILTIFLTSNSLCFKVDIKFNKLSFLRNKHSLYFTLP